MRRFQPARWCRHVDLRPLAALCLPRTGPALLGWREAAVDEGFPEIKMPFVVQRLGEDLEYALQNAAAYRLLKPPMALVMFI